MERVGGNPILAEQMDSPAHEVAFAGLLDGAIDRSYRAAYLILRNDADAEDAVQDSLLAAWRHWGELRDQDRFDAWFGRILLNRCRDLLRRPGRTREIDLDELRVPPGHGAEMERLEHRLDIAAAFDSLNADQRIAVVLRYWADLTVDQIAERTGAPAGTVKSRLHHALQRIREGLERPEVTR